MRRPSSLPPPPLRRFEDQKKKKKEIFTLLRRFVYRLNPLPRLYVAKRHNSVTDDA